MTSACIQHCWNHTGLLAKPSPVDTHDIGLLKHILQLISVNISIEFDENFLDNGILQVMERLHLKDPMSIESLLNPSEEDLNTFEMATDEQIVERAIEPEEQGPEEEAIDIAAELDIPMPEQLSILRKAIQIVEYHDGYEVREDGPIPSLRAILQGLRMRWDMERQNSEVQLSLDHFFTAI